MDSPPKKDFARFVKDDYRPFVAPSKFLFDFIDEQLKQSTSTESHKVRQTLQLQRNLPLIQSFDEPADIKENYKCLIEHILTAYNEVRDLLLTVRTSSFSVVLI